MNIPAEFIKSERNVSSIALIPDSALFCAIHNKFVKNQDIDKRTKLIRYFVVIAVF